MNKNGNSHRSSSLEDVMKRDVFRALDSADPHKAWTVVRFSAIKQLTGDSQVIPVPSLHGSECSYYDLLCVLVRLEQGPLHRLLPSSSSTPSSFSSSRLYYPMGELTQHTRPLPSPTTLELKRPVRPEQELNQDFQYKIYDMRDGVSKSVTFRCVDCEELRCNLSFNVGDIVINSPAMCGVRSIYVVSRCFYVSGLSLEVRVGEEKRRLTVNERQVVAFSLVKCSVDKKRPGVLLDPQPCRQPVGEGVKWMSRREFRDPHRDLLPQTPPEEGMLPPGQRAARRNPRGDLPAPPTTDDIRLRPIPPLPAETTSTPSPAASSTSPATTPTAPSTSSSRKLKSIRPWSRKRDR